MNEAGIGGDSGGVNYALIPLMIISFVIKLFIFVLLMCFLYFDRCVGKVNFLYD